MSSPRAVPLGVNTDLAQFLAQLSSFRLLQNSASPACTATSTSASAVLTDASASTALTIYSRYAGLHGTTLGYKTTKQVESSSSIFDLEVYFPDAYQVDAKTINNTVDTKTSPTPSFARPMTFF